MCMIFLTTYRPPPLIIFREWEREGQEGAEKHACEWGISIGCLLHTPQTGSKPASLACALIRIWTYDLSVYRMMCGPTEPHQPGLNQLPLLKQLTYFSTFITFYSKISSGRGWGLPVSWVIFSGLTPRNEILESKATLVVNGFYTYC